MKLSDFKFDDDIEKERIRGHQIIEQLYNSEKFTNFLGLGSENQTTIGNIGEDIPEDIQIERFQRGMENLKHYFARH